jgi:predicted porin
MTAGAAGSAMAQSSVTIYGIIDTGVVYTTNANANGNAVFKMPSLTGSFLSRIGFRGTEDLGGGLQAIFVLESGFAPDTGAMGQGNRIFGRQSYVGLKSDWGQVTLGRQINMTYLSQLKTDVMGPNIFAIGSIDPYRPMHAATTPSATSAASAASRWVRPTALDDTSATAAGRHQLCRRSGRQQQGLPPGHGPVGL